MDTKQDSSDARLRTRLLSKLNPENFRQMSGAMAAVLGFLLDTAFVRPSITGKDPEHKPTIGCRGIHTFVQADEVDSKTIELRQGVY